MVTVLPAMVLLLSIALAAQTLFSTILLYKLAQTSVSLPFTKTSSTSAYNVSLSVLLVRLLTPAPAVLAKPISTRASVSSSVQQALIS